MGHQSLDLLTSRWQPSERPALWRMRVARASCSISPMSVSSSAHHTFRSSWQVAGGLQFVSEGLDDEGEVVHAKPVSLLSTLQ